MSDTGGSAAVTDFTPTSFTLGGVTFGVLANLAGDDSTGYMQTVDGTNFYLKVTEVAPVALVGSSSVAQLMLLLMLVGVKAAWHQASFFRTL